MKKLSSTLYDIHINNQMDYQLLLSQLLKSIFEDSYNSWIKKKKVIALWDHPFGDIIQCHTQFYAFPLLWSSRVCSNIPFLVRLVFLLSDFKMNFELTVLIFWWVVVKFELYAVSSWFHFPQPSDLSLFVFVICLSLKIASFRILFSNPYNPLNFITRD